MRWVILMVSFFLCGCGSGEKPNEVETWSVVAELEEASDFPTLKEIRPYRDALIAHRYRIVEWRGDRGPPVPESSDLAIYHWAIVEGKATKAADLKPGAVLELEIQRMIDRKDLENRFRKNSLDAFDLQVFYAVEASVRRKDSD